MAQHVIERDGAILESPVPRADDTVPAPRHDEHTPPQFVLVEELSQPR
jgi:hypothetical protein